MLVWFLIWLDWGIPRKEVLYIPEYFYFQRRLSCVSAHWGERPILNSGCTIKVEPRWSKKWKEDWRSMHRLDPYCMGVCMLQLLLSVVIRHQVPPALNVNWHQNLSMDAVLHQRLHLPLSHSEAAWTEKLLPFLPLWATDSQGGTLSQHFNHWVNPVNPR